MKHWLARFFIDHPLIGGLVFVAVGAFMARSSITEGTQYAQFTNGVPVKGTVKELIGSTGLPAKYRMIAQWRDERTTHTAAIDLFKNEFDSLKAGDEVPLLMSNADHTRAMVEKYYANNKPVEIAGMSATPLVFVGLAMALFGIGLAGAGLVKKRAPARVVRPVPPRHPRPR